MHIETAEFALADLIHILFGILGVNRVLLLDRSIARRFLTVIFIGLLRLIGLLRILLGGVRLG